MYSNRWWESYLVRYFMPSIAGIALVGWLTFVAGEEFKNVILFSGWKGELSAQILILLILYGNLFCYIASYPVLSFHATRVIDLKDGVWRPNVLDGYLITGVLAIVSLLAAIYVPKEAGFSAALCLVVIVAILQLCRLSISMKLTAMEGLEESASAAYAFAHALAKRRGALEVTKETTGPSPKSEKDDPRALVRSERVTHWHREVIETYRHMREHGNSAFIFVLELVLAAVCFLALKDGSVDVSVKLTRIGIIFAVWAIPAASVHLLGQAMERRFSHFDRRIAIAKEKLKEGAKAQGRAPSKK
jgi:hypothetical protein